MSHREPDRVPFDLTPTVDIYHRLRRELGLPAEDDKPVGIWAEVSPSLDFLDAMQIDFLHLGLNPASTKSPLEQDDGLRYDQWGVGRAKVIRDDGSYYFEMIKNPLCNPTLQQIKDFPWPDPYDPARVEGVREKFLRFRRDTDKAIGGKFTTSIWEQASYLVGIQNWLELMALQPDIACAIMDKTCEVAIGFADVGLKAVGDLIDIYRLSGEDLGTQTSSLISPKMFDRYVRPFHKRLWSYVKNRLADINPDAKMFLHSCGNVRAFIPAWIDLGLDILNPVQPTVAGMQPLELKQEFGSRLVFHGGIDTQQILPNGTPEQVKSHVKECIQAFAPGGGYIAAPAHNVQSDVPVANLIALRDAVLEYGTYPIQ
jgi:uroporphyrinogen decarboxylase